MKRFSYLLTIGTILVARTMAAHPNVLAISEFEDEPTPIVTYNGAPLALDPSSILLQDNWTIVLPPQFTIDSLGLVFMGEPADPTEVNVINLLLGPHELTWVSDVPAPPGAGPFPNPLVIRNFGMFDPGGGARREFFDLRLSDDTVSDAAPTAMLLTVAMTGLGFITRRRNVAA
jgi:hypothetical protein